MTCIIGYKDKVNNRVYIGADSRVTSGDQIRDISSNIKLFKPKNNTNIVVGASGVLSAVQALKYSDVFPGEEYLQKSKLEFNIEYITKHLIISIMELLEKRKFIDKDYLALDIVIGYKDKLFFIDSDFCGIEIDSDYISIGSGSDYALGSLFTSKNDYDNCVVLKMITALQASCISSAVSPPFYIMSTENDELYTINK